ncbi:cell division protein FtsL [Polycladidibacter stylochi]|uniref:cell division protein FtsL n=1 Tax=Polycladidibacter stylochi TaxID=1807766 RepID=UPI001AD8FEAC|nr:hypothetical protein [Pseudovibrio stylochi]
MFLLVVVLSLAAYVYNMKMNNEHLVERIALLQQEIKKEKEDIRFYKAQWSALNQPSRLQGIVERYNSYLQLQPLTGDQITTLDALPVRPVIMEPASARAMGGYASQSMAIQ